MQGNSAGNRSAESWLFGLVIYRFVCLLLLPDYLHSFGDYTREKLEELNPCYGTSVETFVIRVRISCRNRNHYNNQKCAYKYSPALLIVDLSGPRWLLYISI